MQEEKGNEVLNNNPQQVAQNIEKEKKVDWLKILPWAFVVFLVIFGTTFYLLGFFTQEAEDEFTFTQEVDEVEIVQDRDKGDEEVERVDEVVEKMGKLFYREGANIFSYDVETGEKVNLTNNEFGENEITGIFYVNENFIAFSTEGSDTPSSIYKIDLETKNVQEIKEKGVGETVGFVAFYDLDNFAYFVSLDYTAGVEEDWQLILDQNGSTEILDSGITGGRDIYFGDGRDISFSPDGSKLFSFNTINNPVPYEINVHHLEKGRKQKISNGVHPEWLDNETIVFSFLSGSHRMGEYSSDGIYKYNLNTEREVKIESISGNPGKPKVCQESQEMLYISYPSEIWSYDLKTNESKKLLAESQAEFWSVSWLDSERFVYKEVGESDEKILTVSGQPLFLSIYDLNQNAKVEAPDFGTFHKWLPDMTTKF